jgi:hypothetical protein
MTATPGPGHVPQEAGPARQEPVRPDAERAPGPGPAEAGALGSVLAAPRGRPPDAGRPRGYVLALQRRAGNRAVSGLLAATPGTGTVQREGPGEGPAPGDVGPSDEELVTQAIAEKSSNKIKQVRNLAKAGAPRAMELIGIVISESWGWLGPQDETALETLWGTFGDKVLERAKDRPDLWKKSLEGGAELYELPAVKPLTEKFVKDVRVIAGKYLDSNETYCVNELKRLGVADDKGGAPGPMPSAEDQSARQAELVAAIRITREAKQVQEQLRATPVGLERRYHMLADRTLYFPVSFDPNAEPAGLDADPPPDRIEKARAAGVSEEALRRTPWKTVKAQWDMLDTIMQGLSIAYPVAGVGLMRGDKAMGEAVQDDPKAAKAAIVSMLTTTRDSIRETRPRLAGGLAYELVPIHHQLFGGTTGASGIDWKDPIAQAVATEVLQLKSDIEFWKSMGLSTLAAAAFILAEFATAGMATFAGAALLGAGVGIGAGQAIVAWDKALDMRAANTATTGAGTELLASGQADMAMFEAALATVMVFADAVSSVKTLGRALSGAVDRAALGAGAKAAETLGRDLAALAGKAPDRALAERAVVELGAEQASVRTGKSVAELLTIVGEQSPVAGRLKALLAMPEDLLKLTPAELAKRAGSLAAEVQANPATGEALAGLAVERLGAKRVLEMNGGWKSLSLALGNDSAAGKAIMSWRDGLMGDIEAFVRTLPGGADETGAAAVKRTGSQGKFTNDFDISLLGPHASKNRASLRSFVAGRVGTTPDRLGELLLSDFFTDPRRLHLYDQLDPVLRAEVGARAEKVAEATIMARTLDDAEKAGNKELAAQIRAQMKTLGIEEVPFKPLSEADRAALYGKIDDYHLQLETAVSSGDKAAQKELVGKIGDTQGLINATEGGGYFSGGATRQIVSLAEGLIKGGQKPLDAQVYTALLDQLPKLNSEASALLRSGVVASEEAVGAIKGLAKYGNRFRELMRSLEVKVADEAAWDALASRLQKLLHEAKGEAEVTLLKRLESDALQVQQEVEGLVGQFRTASQDVLMQLNRQAAMGGQRADLASIQFLVMATAKMTRAGSALKASLQAISVEMARLAQAAAKHETQSPPAGGAPTGPTGTGDPATPPGPASAPPGP